MTLEGEEQAHVNQGRGNRLEWHRVFDVASVAPTLPNISSQLGTGQCHDDSENGLPRNTHLFGLVHAYTGVPRS